MMCDKSSSFFIEGLNVIKLSSLNADSFFSSLFFVSVRLSFGGPFRGCHFALRRSNIPCTIWQHVCGSSQPRFLSSLQYLHAQLDLGQCVWFGELSRSLLVMLTASLISISW